MLYSCSFEHRSLVSGRKQVQLFKCFGDLYWWNTISRIKPHPCISNSMTTLNLRTRKVWKSKRLLLYFWFCDQLICEAFWEFHWKDQRGKLGRTSSLSIFVRTCPININFRAIFHRHILELCVLCIQQTSCPFTATNWPTNVQKVHILR